MSAEELKNGTGVSAADAEQYDYTSQTESDVDPKIRFPCVDERKLMFKVDMHVVPILCIMYLMAFLDRVNISNAALFGLETDLKLVGTQFNTALVIFFVPYVVFDIPSNILLKRFKPHVWLSVCMFLFGLFAICQGLVHTYSGLLACRFFLGVAEAGIFPGCFYLLAMWYKRSEAQKRFSFFFCSTTLAGAFGGLLATAIGKMDGLRGYRGWRWIFILEGVGTCVISLLLFFAIADFPEEVQWLTNDEKEYIEARLHADVGQSRRHDKLTWKSGLAIFKDYKIIAGGFMYLGLIVPAYGYTYFAPSIIESLGYSAIHTQLLSVPPWACSFVFAMLIATVSDHIHHRFAFVVVPSLISLSGFIVLLRVHDKPHVQYGALFLAAIGAFTAMGVMICWFHTNLAGHQRRAVGSAWQIGFGNIGGIIAVYSFLAKDAPKYLLGYRVCISFTCLSIFADIVYFFGVLHENRKRDRADTAISEDEKATMGDLNPDYRYVL
ncbi:uncharacterized protein FIBRA_06120 [Fibroporia radiculosa]|uniref:Major facilitator superfamily (MFS) profile domain-containing protein n=1 Tax=Fibroporia radiculosa TaxID=599839 RepID=J4H3W7_9APHY|nr:uncharacterized protein FIBRA_06120 [Fibroporia radiculosa]CCM03964.1 predicted protein [Fibroporia radiculosa]